MEIHLDRPRDGLLVGRAELLTGWLAPATGAPPVASCGDTPILLRPCFHPAMLERSDAQGFWGYLFVQELLGEVRAGRLAIELRAGARHLGTSSLRVTPSANVLATEYPLDLGSYDVPPPPGAAPADPPAIVFPGLGGVGGASLNELMRVAMLRAGLDVPVHFEADRPDLWRRLRERQPMRFRWIDGHGCYPAGDDLDGPHVRVTMLREPARRLLSVFDYGTLVHPDAFASAGFDEFLRSPAARRATQAVGLLRVAGVASPELLPEDELLDRARIELDDAYALVGVTERFEESVLTLCRLAGLASIGMWWRVLAAPRSARLEDLPPRTRARLDALVAVDRRLYEHAAARLQPPCDSAFGAALARYQAAAATERPLPDVLKQLECLRWRQVLGEPPAVTSDAPFSGVASHA